jgi:hypothetical protein
MGDGCCLENQTRVPWKIPRSPVSLLSFYGIKRKVLMLIYQDAFPEEARITGIVWDRHVDTVLKNELKWTHAGSEATRAQDVESWMNPELYLSLNEGIAGLRQLWRVWSNHQLMEDVAEKISKEAWWLLRGVTRTVKVTGAPKATLRIVAGEEVLATDMEVEGFVVHPQKQTKKISY